MLLKLIAAKPGEGFALVLSAACFGERQHRAGENQGDTAIATDKKPENFGSVETSLAALVDHLGIASAHFAGRGSADLQGFASIHPERIASLTLLCPAVLDTATLAPLAGRLLVVTGDHGPGARRVQAGLADLPQASVIMPNDYAGPTWADIAAERGDSIGAAMQQFLTVVRHIIGGGPAGAGRRDCRHFL